MQQMSPHLHLGILCVGLLTYASFYMTWYSVGIMEEIVASTSIFPPSTSVTKPLSSYSFIGADHPKRLHAKQRLIKVEMEESVHYEIVSQEADMEWTSFTSYMGDGHVRLGPEKRTFSVAMSHDLHCLRVIRGALEKGWQNMDDRIKDHVHHCFNYLRQHILCAADTTLEPGDFTTRNFTTMRKGATHTCVDWSPVYNVMWDNWGEWEAFRIQHGLPGRILE